MMGLRYFVVSRIESQNRADWHIRRLNRGSTDKRQQHRLFDAVHALLGGGAMELKVVPEFAKPAIAWMHDLIRTVAASL